MIGSWSAVSSAEICVRVLDYYLLEHKILHPVPILKKLLIVVSAVSSGENKYIASNHQKKRSLLRKHMYY